MLFGPPGPTQPRPAICALRRWRLRALVCGVRDREFGGWPGQLLARLPQLFGLRGARERERARGTREWGFGIGCIRGSSYGYTPPPDLEVAGRDG